MKNILKKISLLFLLGSFVAMSACKLSISNTEKNNLGRVSFYVDSLSAERTVLPETSEGYDPSKLTNLLLTWTKDGATDSKRFDTLNKLMSASLTLEPGSWTFVLSGSINSVLFEGSTSAVVQQNQNTEVNFVLSSNNEGIAPVLKLKFVFPTEKNVTFVNGKYTDYYASNGGSNYSNYTISSLEPVVDESNPELSYFYIEKKLNNGSYNCEYNFKFMDKDNNVAFCRDSAIMAMGKTTSAEYELNKFYQAYKLNYFFNTSDEEPGYVDYYTTTEGYTLYGSGSYTWYEDVDCTTRAYSKSVGQASGDKNFYLAGDNTFYTVYVKDFDENVVCSVLVKKDSSFYLYESYISANNTSVYYDLDGKYINGRYYDTNKNSSYSTYSRYYPTADMTIYVDYVPFYNFTLISVNSGEVLTQGTIRSYYRLYDSLWSDWRNSYYYQDFIVKKYYSNSDKTGILNTGSYYYPTSDVVIYADDQKVDALYISFIDQNDKLLFIKPCNYTYSISNSYFYIDGVKYYYGANVCADEVYTDYERTTRISLGSYYYPEEDVNIYVDLYSYSWGTAGSVNYNKAYKTPVQGTNTRLVSTGFGAGSMDKNKEYVWYMSTDSSNGSSSNTTTTSLYYTVLDSEANPDAVYDGEWEEVLPVNTTPYHADIQRAKTNLSKYIITDTTDLYIAYKYYFEEGKNYNVEFINNNNNSNLLEDCTYAYIYIIDETAGRNVCNYSGNGSFTAPSTGEYTVYISGSTKTAVKAAHHIYSLSYFTPEYTVSYSNEDISVTKSETANTITFTAASGYEKYEWKLGRTVIGNESSLVLNKADYAGVDTIVVTLRAMNFRRKWDSTTIYVELGE